MFLPFVYWVAMTVLIYIWMVLQIPSQLLQYGVSLPGMLHKDVEGSGTSLWLSDVKSKGVQLLLHRTGMFSFSCVMHLLSFAKSLRCCLLAVLFHLSESKGMVDIILTAIWVLVNCKLLLCNVQFVMTPA